MLREKTKTHGGYRNLKSYQTTTLIYDLTITFYNNFGEKYSRTRDQMIQAARSGRQNIAEASQASGTSKKTEIKLMGVARASLEELLLDFEDYLRQHNLQLWNKDDPRAQEIRALGYKSDRSYETYKSYLSSAESFANCIICLIHQANYLLDHQIESLKNAFIENGGFTENLYQQRKNKKIGLISLIGLIILEIGLIAPLVASAQRTMSNDNYILRMGNLNYAAGKTTGSGFKLGFTAGETAPGLYTGTNYKVRAGFQYIKSIIPFSFSISNLFVDFGTLNPGEPITRTGTLTVSNGSAQGYQVTAIENHPLRVLSTGIDIPDTTCDGGSCTETTSAAWSSLLTYGFGYRCDNLSGTDCASGFSTGTYYKQFANLAAGETARSVMTGTNVGRGRQVQITYKVNISASQAPGTYQTIIKYIATPTF